MIDVPKIIELLMIWPVVVLIAAVGLILFSSLFLEGRTSKYFLVAIAGIGLLTAIISVLKIIPLVRIGEKRLALQGLFPPNMLFNSVLFDPLFLFMTVFLCAFLFGVLVLSTTLWQKSTWEWPVFLCLMLGSLIGMILLSSTRNLIFFAVAFELASMPSYVLVGFRRFNVKSAEGSAKYVLFGAACSAIMIYGISLLYGLTGSFDFQKISLALAGGGFPLAKIVALLCLLVGMGFKISLVPMHFWCPDAFEAAGADVAAWLSVASKSAALIALGRFVQILTFNANDQFNQHLVLALTVVAVLTMTVANLSAYWQSSVKRLLAYSSIAHAGYILCGLTVLNDTTGLAAVVAYIIVYMLMNLGAFAVAGLIEQQTGSDDLKNFAGLSRRSPALSALMIFFLFSLVGLPPLAGFAVKWILLSVLWQHNLTFLVAAILANTLFSLFYYMRIARAMYFESSDLPELRMPISAKCLLGVCAAGLIVLFLGWGVLNNLTGQLLTGVFG